MRTLVRIALQVVVFFLLLSAVVGLGSGDTGPIEKILLGLLAVGLVSGASRVKRIGRPSAPRPS